MLSAVGFIALELMAAVFTTREVFYKKSASLIPGHLFVLASSMTFISAACSSLRARILDDVHQRGVLPLHRLAAVLLERPGNIGRGLVSLVNADDTFATLDC